MYQLAQEAQHIIGSLDQGSTQRTLTNYLAWSAGQHRVLTLAHEGGYFWPAAQAYASVHSLELNRLRLGARGLACLPGTLAGTFRFLLRPGVGQTQVCWTYPAMVASRLSPRSARRIWMMPRAVLGRADRDVRAAARASRRADMIVYASSASKVEHEALGFARHRAVVLAHGVDTRLFRPNHLARAEVLHELGLPDDTFIIGYVARPHPAKRHALLIEAFNRFRRGCPNAVLLLVGEAASAPGSGTISRRPGFVGASIFALGARSDLPRLNAAFDVAIMLSQTDGFPSVLLEAMSSGTTTIATAVGATPELLAETNGIIVEPESAAITNALQQVWQRTPNECVAAAIAGRRRVCQNFSAARFVKRLDAIVFPEPKTEAINPLPRP